MTPGFIIVIIFTIKTEGPIRSHQTLTNFTLQHFYHVDIEHICAYIGMYVHTYMITCFLFYLAFC